MKQMNKLVILAILLAALCTVIMPASVEDNLFADFSASKTSGSTPLTVAFTDKSIGSPTSWKWSYGDGSPLEIKFNPTQYFTNWIRKSSIPITISNI